MQQQRRCRGLLVGPKLSLGSTRMEAFLVLFARKKLMNVPIFVDLVDPSVVRCKLGGYSLLIRSMGAVYYCRVKIWGQLCQSSAIT